MDRLTLTEFRTAEGVPLSLHQIDELRRVYPGVRVDPAPGLAGRYNVTPDQHVGVVCVPGLVIEIRPKIPMSSVLFMLSYAADETAWHRTVVEFREDEDLVEALAVMLAKLVEHATRRGLLNGYQTLEESLPAPRGRVRFDEQIRRRPHAWLPIEVRHDEFTADVLENRLLLAALLMLSRLPLRSARSRRELARAQRLFGNVCPAVYRPPAVPDVTFNRLNRHYEPAVTLARLVLRGASVDLGAGRRFGSSWLADMNRVFEHFVRKALRSALQADSRTFPDRPAGSHLDEAAAVGLKPDLCLINRWGRPAWVGDAKYKRLPSGAYRHADLYQMLAYLVALDLPEGTLIYAADEGVSTADHIVVRVGKRLRVVALDLSAPPKDILRRIAQIAQQVKVGVQARAVA